MITIDEVYQAAERLSPVLRHTPIQYAHAVSTAVGHELWIKQEQLQRTGSYKIRGAYNFISQLPAGSPVVAASAGNHAQGVALAAHLTGRQADIYMPRRASLPKIEATEGYGANTILIDGDLEDCVAAAKEQARQTGSTFVPPFDHPHVIAGQGTVGLELIRDLPENIAAVVVPVGGGGLISGIATVVKNLRPSIKVIGVEATGAPTMTRSIREGRPVKLESTKTMADGIAMREVSDLTLEHVQRYVDDLVLVTEDEMSHASLLLLERAKAVVEPGAATSVAAVIAGEVSAKGPVCAVLSGGNVDPVLLMNIISHGLTSSGRYFAVRVIIPDEPGSLSNVVRLVADMGMNIIDIEHHRSGHHLETSKVEVVITLETRDRAQQELFLLRLENQGLTAELET